jgi:hypothetical protein
MSVEKFNSEPREKSGEYFKVEDFMDLNLPEVLPPYSGKGSKSSKEDYDPGKKEYLDSLGVEVPEGFLDESGKVKERALFVTMFIVATQVVASEEVRRIYGEDEASFLSFLNDRNFQLEEARLDKFGYRRVLPDGSLFEDHLRSLNFSDNAEKRVSREELNGVVEYVFDQLKKSE